ncbi:hypothetical protein VHEMI03917 [[Torrubiella] hemipterigena]|uniref:Ubiquitin-conjugating enzyme E2C-binding protein n=1 Tax=[Torrubiella] hemipterigena TaxID=1531966 RepID=A0A0A1TET1_9HYPO|nr:hypothetical protein VHEMI03917 [[Torrubiella] hemipterigena]
MAPPPPKPSPSENAIIIYAELLTNLRQVTVKAVLPSVADSSTEAKVVGGGKTLVVKHGEQVQELQLPARITADGPLPVSRGQSKDLTWRIPIARDELQGGHFVAEQQPLPWTAVDLVAGSHISCRACNTEIVANGSIKEWKDLPSEGWAEMMEFWHCHKPVDHDHAHDHAADEEHLTKRGYGANSAILSRPGTGFIDLMSFMLSGTDCKSLLYLSPLGESFPLSRSVLNPETNVKLLGLCCSQCRAEVGSFNVITASVNLFKWRVICETNKPSSQPSSSECLVAALTSTISRSGSSKSVIIPATQNGNTDDSEKVPMPLHLWVLNNHVVYSSSLHPGVKTAVKILYKDTTLQEANKMADSLNGDVQDIVFPGPAVADAREALIWSTSILPHSERSFQAWSVGLLRRWSP